MEQNPTDYYSSDEEIAWGRVTLREIKRELARKPTKICRRQSDSHISSFYFTPSTTFSEKQDEEKTNSSATSAYFTPNETLNKKDLFLESLARVIESENCSEVVNLPEVNTEEHASQTLMQILEEEKGRECKLLDSIQQTLLENTIQSPIHKTDNSHISTCTIEDSCYEDESVIVLSDESQSFQEEEFNADIHNQVKVELSESGSTEYSIEKSTDPDESFNSYHEESGSEKHEKSDSGELEEKLQAMDLQHDALDISGLSPLKTKSFQRVSSHLQENPLEPLQDISFQSESEVDQNCSLKFNDTLEEMEMALRVGLNYEMPDEDTQSLSSSSKGPSPLREMKPTGIPVLKKRAFHTPNKFDYIQSPIADYIKASPSHDTFKLPLKPVKSKIATPNPKSQQSRQFKNIISPVGVYIKNSPAGCLKQNVAVKTVPLLKSSANLPLGQQNKENVVFPEVMYKPAHRVIESVQREIVLPKSIQKIVVEPTVTKHEARIRTGNKFGVCKKLIDGDLTLAESTMFNQSVDQDVSFVTTKQAFIK